MAAPGPPSLPEDWEDQIVRAYTAFGWFSRLRGRAPEPSEDWNPELHPRGQAGAPNRGGGRFRRKPTGVRLDGPPPEPAWTPPVPAPAWEPPPPAPLPAIARPKPAPGPKERPAPPPRDPGVREVERLDGQEALKRLVAAGYSPSEARHWTERGIVYQHPTGPGRNPVFGFAASPDAEVESSLAADHLRTTGMRDSLGLDEISLRDARRSGADPAYIARLERQADKRRRDLIEAHNDTVRHEDAARARFGSGGKEQVGEYHDRAVEDATDHVAKQLAKMPAIVDEDDRPVPFMVQFDGSEVAGDKLGTTMMDGTTVSIGLDRYFDPMPADDEHFYQTGEKYLGRYVAGHEVGHALDLDNDQDPHASAANTDLWEGETGNLSGYGRTNVHEGYAEMFALWLARPDDPRVRAYAERFGWGKRQRKARRTAREDKISQVQHDYAYRVREGRSVYDDMNSSGALPQLVEED